MIFYMIKYFNPEIKNEKLSKNEIIQCNCLILIIQPQIDARNSQLKSRMTSSCRNDRAARLAKKYGS